MACERSDHAERSAAVCATLANAGWTVHNRVGRPISLRNGELRLSPFKDFTAVVNGDLTVEALSDHLTEAGVDRLPVYASKK